jgi:putative DNA primase/helicase
MKKQQAAQQRLATARAQRKQRRAAPLQMLPSPAAPMAVARCFVEACCVHDGKANELTLHFWGGCWWMWRTTHWMEAEPRAVRALLWHFTEHASYIDAKGNPAPWLPNRYKISDVLEALSAIVVLPDDFEQPGWLDGREGGPIVATSNGLLDIASHKLLPHSPLHFGQVSVPFPYDPDASKPKRWHAFLEELWPDEPDAIDVLGEWFGYVISGRLDLHKILVMVGPTRGGKGVIARILTALIGKRNVCGPTLSSLGSEFGLAPLLGKSLAVISDARSGGGKNSSIVVERLLSISGEDMLTVNRKYRDQWNGKLPVRLHLISNELPRLGDASSAIVGRLVLLLTTRSWLGKENYELETELRAELTGILNWALEGLRRLTIDNGSHFTRVETAEEAITTMRDLASPVGAFVRERCKLDPEAEIAVDVLYAEYKDWCQACEYPKSPKAHFGRDLRAACPAVRRTRPRDGSKRLYVYANIRLRTDEDDDEAELLTKADNWVVTRSTRTRSRKQPPSGPSGRSDHPIVAPNADSQPGEAATASPGDGPVHMVEPGLNRRRVQELADWYQNETHRRYNEGALDTAELDADLRLVLREEVAFPEHVDIEFERVMAEVFRGV